MRSSRAPVARVMRRLLEKTGWLKDVTIVQKEIRMKPIMSVMVIGMPFLYDSTVTVQHLTTSIKLSDIIDVIFNCERYVICCVALYADSF